MPRVHRHPWLLEFGPALVALRELHSLADYQALKTVADDRWPTLRDEVLAELRRAAAGSPSGVGEIFVYEGLLDDAIAVADSAPYDYAMVEQVADAAIQTHPDWVIRMGANRRSGSWMAGSHGTTTTRSPG